MPSESYSFLKRQKPTRMPYSCQAQLGTSGCSATPVGAGSTWRAIGRAMSQTSRFTIVQTITFALPGSLSAGRSTIAEYSARSRGIIVMTFSCLFLGLQFRQRHDLFGSHDEAEGCLDTQERRVVQFGFVH